MPRKKQRGLSDKDLLTAIAGFLDKSPADKARIRRAESDLELFGKTYFPDRFPQPFAVFHRELLADLAGTGRATADRPEWERGLRLVVAAPREHAKSTLVSFLYAIWAIVFRKRSYVVIVSDTETVAKERLADLKEELETNELLRKDFGDLVGDKWSELSCVTRHGVKIVVRGAGQQIRGLVRKGKRPDLVICDDLENDEAVESPEQRKKLRRWFFGALCNAVTMDGDLVVIGSILHHDALLRNIMEGDETEGRDAGRWVRRTYKAIQEDGTALWPERWPLEKLAVKKGEIGSRKFGTEYNQDPSDDEATVFHAEWFRLYRPEELRQSLRVYSYCDPAIGKKKRNDFFADVTIGVSREGWIYVLEAWAKRIGVLDQVRRLMAVYERWHALRLGIEAVAYQEALKEVLDDEARKAHLFIPTEAVGHQVDKEARISTLAPLIENGTIRFAPEQLALRENLRQFPHAAHDDLADALEGAVSLARRRGPIEGRGTGVRAGGVPAVW